MNIFTQGAQPACGFETLTVSSVSKALTASVYSTFESTNNTHIDAKIATITTETNSIRVRFDGSAPTSAVGHLIPAGTSLELQSLSQIRNFRVIATGSDATITVTYWGS